MKKLFFIVALLLSFRGFSQGLLTSKEVSESITTFTPSNIQSRGVGNLPIQSLKVKRLRLDTLIKAISGDLQIGLNLKANILNPTFEGNRVSINSTTPTIMMVNTANNANINALELSANQEIKVGNGALIMQGNGGINSMYIQNNDGNVGIGTNTPTAKLEVDGSIKFGNGIDLQTALNNKANSSNPSFTGTSLFSKDFQSIGSPIPSGVVLITNPSFTYTSIELGVGSGINGSWLQARSILSNTSQYFTLNPTGGNVGVGITNGTKTLSVNGSIGFGGLASKDLQTELNLKANLTDLTSKANVTDVNALLNFKVNNISFIDSIAALKNIIQNLVVTPDNKIIVKPTQKIELFKSFNSELETETNYTWKGRTIYTQKFLINWASPDIVLVSGVQDMYYAKHVDVSINNENGFEERYITMGRSIEFNPTNNTIKAYRPDLTTGRYAQQAEIIIQYTKQ